MKKTTQAINPTISERALKAFSELRNDIENAHSFNLASPYLSAARERIAELESLIFIPVNFKAAQAKLGEMLKQTYFSDQEISELLYGGISGIKPALAKYGFEFDCPGRIQANKAEINVAIGHGHYILLALYRMESGRVEVTGYLS